MASNTTEGEVITPHRLVTSDQLKQVLLADKGSNAHLESWNLVDFTKPGDNYGSAITCIEVKYSEQDSNYEVKYVAKLNPCSSYKSIGDISNAIFTKEIKFYQNLLPQLNSGLLAAGKEPLRFPKCYHVVLEKGKEQIYLEDLRERGFKMFEKSKGLSKAHTDLVLKELARLHAASYMLQTKSKVPLDVMHDFLQIDFRTYTENSEVVFMQSMQEHLTIATDILRKVGGYEKAVSWVEGLRPGLKALLTTGLKSDRFRSVCHGDCWNNNLLFRYNEDGQPLEVMLLDLQLSREASLATDLNFFLYTSLNGDIRSPNLDNFLSTYFSAYNEVLEKADLRMHFTASELLQEFLDKNTIGAFFGLKNVPGILMSSQEIPDISGKNVDMKKIMKEFKEKTLAMVDKNPLMKPRFLAIFDELMETGLIA